MKNAIYIPNQKIDWFFGSNPEREKQAQLLNKIRNEYLKNNASRNTK